MADTGSFEEWARRMVAAESSFGIRDPEMIAMADQFNAKHKLFPDADDVEDNFRSARLYRSKLGLPYLVPVGTLCYCTHRLDQHFLQDEDEFDDDLGGCGECAKSQGYCTGFDPEGDPAAGFGNTPLPESLRDEPEGEDGPPQGWLTTPLWERSMTVELNEEGLASFMRAFYPSAAETGKAYIAESGRSVPAEEVDPGPGSG